MEWNRDKLMIVSKALAAAEKSAQRLAAKEGQPEAVAMEYRKFGVGIATLIKEVDAEIVRLDSPKKKQKKEDDGGSDAPASQ